jgi:hypothetical protein
MDKVTTVGIDLAKNVFSLHGVAARMRQPHVGHVTAEDDDPMHHGRLERFVAAISFILNHEQVVSASERP